MNGDYMTMREIGWEFGTTSHKVGKKLKELGLRTSDGRPSRQAFEAGLCDQRWAPGMENYLWAWHGERVVRLLRESGFGGSEAKEQTRNTSFLNKANGRQQNA
jgi:hypothetical protein